jgi:hypothetical protein
MTSAINRAQHFIARMNVRAFSDRGRTGGADYLELTIRTERLVHAARRRLSLGNL